MLFMLPPFMGYGFGMPGMPYPLGAAVPGMVSMPTLSPPSSPPTAADCTIAKFCEKYKLGDAVAAGLDKLGFCFGDELNSVMQQEYTEAGFKVLEWKRLWKAYRKLKHDTFGLPVNSP
jgi:hypothetical protein